tara:strand:- start:1165 stop:1602 length:438 start_codon:yes stop_codon:yes gene_type:complete
MDLTIRPFRNQDAEAISLLYRVSVEQLGSHYYDPAQITAWASLTPEPQRLVEQMRDGRLRLLAVDAGDRVLGFADLEYGGDGSGHLDYFYIHPAAAKCGVGRALCAASEAAKAFFIRQGYQERQRRDLMLGDVPIHNYAMRKTLI